MKESPSRESLKKKKNLELKLKPMMQNSYSIAVKMRLTKLLRASTMRLTQCNNFRSTNLLKSEVFHIHLKWSRMY